MAKAKDEDWYRWGKYDETIPDKVYEFINQCKDNLTEVKLKVKYYKGEACPEEMEVGNKFPSTWELAQHLGIKVGRVYDWDKRHPEFSEALVEFRELQKHYVIQNTLRGYYKEMFAIFMMKNISDWTDTPKVKIDPKTMNDADLIKYAKMALAMIGAENEPKN